MSEHLGYDANDPVRVIIDVPRDSAFTPPIYVAIARIRRAVRARGHFPDEQGAPKCAYPRHPGARPNRQRRGPMGHALERALNAFTVAFEGRINQCVHIPICSCAVDRTL